VQSLWRVACVRIPRFPIGAVWRAARRGEIGMLGEPAPQASSACRGRPGSGQLQLPLSLPDAAPPAAPLPSLPGSSTPPSPALAHWDDMAIALTDVTGKRLRAVSAAAGRAGVRAGMRPAQARALCADLVELPWDDLTIAHTITEASALLLAASPQVTPVAGAPGLWWVGASGFDAVGGERELARSLLRVARRWHPRPRVAIAGSCVAARAATWAGASFDHHTDERALLRALVRVVPAGGDAAYLAPAPLALVPMDDELRAALVALGLRTVGALAALTAEDVERRWGEIGLRGWRLARADDPRRPVLSRVEAHPMVDVELGTPSDTMEPVLFLVRAALDRLVHELIAHGRAAAAVAITLTLDDTRGALGEGPAHTVTREARPARPLARVVPLFERCRALLDAWPLTAPVIAVRVAIVAAAPLTGEQGDLLSTSWRDMGAADAALERLRAELGPGAVVRARAQDTHRPEKAGVWRELDAEGVQQPVTAAGGLPHTPAVSHSSDRPIGSPFTARLHPVRVLSMVADPPPPRLAAARRALDPPEPVDVVCDGERPTVVTWRGHRISVTRALGPERLSGDWWDDGYRRDYWRCESPAGDFTVFLDRAGDEWALQGWGD
jgi:protein ImuB